MNFVERWLSVSPDGGSGEFRNRCNVGSRYRDLRLGVSVVGCMTLGVR